ncbi:MAG TPA: anti-sigma factor [Pyrinomonadaceae bacterium]|nr:anti-sigma factor [Pyrinomonadaceae bacterium]
MPKRNQTRPACARVFACALAAGLTFVAATLFGSRTSSSHSKRAPRAAAAQRGTTQRVDIPLRSLTTRARGKLTIVSSEGGGRARLTAMNLPDPQTVAAGATTYVVWAVSGGRIVRLGELKRDARGNGGLAFERPEGLDHYGVIVTAEQSADAPRPSDPVLTTRADEAAALYPKTEDVNPAGDAGGAASAASDADNAKSAKPPVPDLNSDRHARRARAGDFYAEVDDALVSNGGGRVIELDGDSNAPRARGAARATMQRGSAYVRANFRGVPLPPAIGANVYILWGVFPDGRIVYMGSLPADEAINTAEIYVRVAGFDSDDYALFVTAEQQRPAPAPSPRRVLTPRNASYVVK